MKKKKKNLVHNFFWENLQFTCLTMAWYKVNIFNICPSLRFRTNNIAIYNGFDMGYIFSKLKTLG